MTIQFTDQFVSILEYLDNISDRILLLFSIFVSIISIYNKIKSNFTAKISSFIKDAEERTDLTNPEKMKLVVSWVKDLIPRLFKVVFNDKVLENIAENIYQDMKGYMNNYMNNKTGLTTNQVVKTIKSLDDDPESIISDHVEVTTPETIKI